MVPTSAISRPPRADWDQGDIVRRVYLSALDRPGPAILVTPACDIDHGASYWTLAALFPDSEIAGAVVASKLKEVGLELPPDGAAIEVSKKKYEPVKKELLKLLKQQHQRYHWLPVAFDGIEGYVVDFACTTCLKADEVRNKAERILSLESSWREQVSARYVAYMGRVGTDDYEPDDVSRHADRVLSSIGLRLMA